MNPLALVEAHLMAGRLVELVPSQRLDVALHWQHAQLGARLMDALTADVVEAARASLVTQAARSGGRRPLPRVRR